MRSAHHALATEDCAWPGCPSEASHAADGGPLCERHYRLQTHGSTLPVPERCPECRALLTSAHSEACSSFVDQRRTPEVPVTAPTRCKRAGCMEAATEHSLTVRSNRYRQLCQAHYEAERAKSAKPQRIGAPVPDVQPPVAPVGTNGLPHEREVACDDLDPHYSHEWMRDDGSEERLVHCPGRAGLPRSGEPEPPRPRPRALLPLDDPPAAPLPPSPFDLPSTLEQREPTMAERVLDAYAGAICDALAAWGQALIDGGAVETLALHTERLLSIQPGISTAVELLAGPPLDEVPSAG